MTVKEAKKILKEIGLELEINIETEEDLSDKIITKQTPEEGIKIDCGNPVYVEAK